ncbi:hypothetical protein HWV62_37081 [Athelia sp. TMB]|nr:hypothetical protein HWV62_37081 [Athelia sp. TMB]
MPMSYLSGKSSSPGTASDDLDYSMRFWDESANASMMLDSAYSSMESTPLCTDKNGTFYDSSEPQVKKEFPFSDSCSFGSESDVIIVTSDYVCFHLHSDTLLATTNNHFNHILVNFTPADGGEFLGTPMFTVCETSTVFTVVVCAIYDLPFADYSPSFETLDEGVAALQTYGVIVRDIVIPNTPLFEILLTHAGDHAIELYTLAAHYDMHDLAVAASSHLLAFTLSSLTDDAATRIGGVYLKRLFFMHLGRAEALRRSLLPPPYPHEPTAKCDRSAQATLTRAWSLAASSLAWDPRAYIMTPAKNDEQRKVVLLAIGGVSANGGRDGSEGTMANWIFEGRDVHPARHNSNGISRAASLTPDSDGFLVELFKLGRSVHPAA